MKRREVYLVMSNRETGLDWEEELMETLAVCSNLKKAYEVGLFLGRISSPDSSYRKVLETIKVKGAYTLKQQKGDQQVTIVRIKYY